MTSPADIMAAVAPLAETILPKNATPMEKALLSVELATLAETDALVIATIWSPYKCPAVLLPWLAWALSVDVWNSNWPEQRKRDVIAASPMVHRLKGTRWAVERVLEAMGFDANITEWWESEPVARHGTFHLELLYKDGAQEFSLDEVNRGLQAVVATKPKSRVFTAETVITARGVVSVAAWSTTNFTWAALPLAFDPEAVQAITNVGAAAYSRFLWKVS